MIKAQKFLTSVLCVSIAVSNITPVFATVTNDTLTFEDMDTTALEQTEVLYEKAGSYFVTIPKTISLGADKQSPYSVKVEGDIPSDKQVYVSPIDGIKDTEDFDFYMHDQSAVNPKADVVATVTQNKFYWNFSEVADGYAETNNQVTAEDLTSGAWKGTFDFEINMHKVEPERPDFTLTTDGDVTLPVGESHQLNAYIDGVESNSDVTWSCDNEEVTINNGLIEIPSDLVAGSKLTITVTKDDMEVSFTITISETIPDFTLTTDGDVTIPIGETQQLNAYVDGVKSNSDVEWSCDNDEITINNGLIEIPSTLQAGTEITITVTKDGKDASFIVTVGEEDAVEIKDWIYTLDDTNKTITLKQYTGSDTDVTVHNKYKSGNTIYRTKIASNTEMTGNPGIGQYNYMFNNCNKIETINFETGIDTSETYNMSKMFDNCSKLVSINFNSFDTKNVTSMESMFYGCQHLKNLDLSSFDTSKVTNMVQMFWNCNSLENLDLSNFDTGNVTDMCGMFGFCSMPNLDLSSFNTSNVTNMKWMFQKTSIEIIDLSSFDTSKVTNMIAMFAHSSVTNLDLSSFNTGNVTDMSTMFYNCTSLKTIYVTQNKWSTSKANTGNMFYNCGTSSVTYK